MPVPAWVGQSIHSPGREGYLFPDLWNLHLFRYHAVLELPDGDHEIRPGHAVLLPPNVPFAHRWGPGRHRHRFAHFAWEAPPRTEVRSLGPRFEAAWDWLLPGPGDAARLWAILWELERPEPSRETPVDRLERFVVENLSEPLPLTRLADAAGLSISQLARWTERERGASPAEIVRRARAEAARHLLERTSRSTESVATAVGVADAQSLNKLMRRVYGRPPSAFR